MRFAIAVVHDGGPRHGGTLKTRSPVGIAVRVLPRAAPLQSAALALLVLLEGVFPALFAVLVGSVVGGITSHNTPRVVSSGIWASVVFLAMQAAGSLEAPLIQSVGSRLRIFLRERALDATLS